MLKEQFVINQNTERETCSPIYHMKLWTTTKEKELKFHIVTKLFYNTIEPRASIKITKQQLHYQKVKCLGHCITHE